MQRFRFLLPLLVLTLAVTAISLTVRSYSSHSNNKESVTTQPEQLTYDSQKTSVESSNSEVSPTPKSFFSRIFGGNKSSSTNQLELSVTPTPPPTNATFSESSVEVPINQERMVSILLDNGEAPTAFTFHLSFDPRSVTIVKVEPGDIWKEAAIFTKANKIDNTAGKVVFSAGQALGTEKGSGKVLLKIYLKAKATAASGSELMIDTTSEFAYVGLDYAVPLASKSINIQVTQ